MWVATHKLLTDIPVTELKTFRWNMFGIFEQKYPEIKEEILDKKVLSDELGERF